MSANTSNTANTTASSIYVDNGDPLFHAAATLREVYIWILVVLGLPGHVAAVVTTLFMPVTTATFYVALLSVADALALVLKLIFHQMFTYDVFPMSGPGCRFMNMIVELSSCYANWVLVLVCFERFISVRFPLKKLVYFTKRRSYISAGILFLVLFLCFLHLLYSKNYCEGGNEFYNHAWLWIQSALYFLIPFVLVAVMTVAIIVCLRKYRRARQQLQTSASSNGGSNAERAISIMLVSAAIVFLVLALPTCVFYLIEDETMNDWNFTLGDRYMFYQVSTFMADATHAVNFYVYFVSAAKFRNRFLELIGMKKCLPFPKREQGSAAAADGLLLETTQYSHMAPSAENIESATAI